MTEKETLLKAIEHLHEDVSSLDINFHIALAQADLLIDALGSLPDPSKDYYPEAVEDIAYALKLAYAIVDTLPTDE
jgi:hypothetical protein